ncbi:MAG: phosphate signaling complex protein PhoU [Methanoregulaceae archaeon]|nr:MAG: phosphate signaling complex protein PhoU [Methanoregulaceae archaeon]
MSEKFHAELKTLRKDMIDMAGFSRNMLCDALNALTTEDIEAAQEIASRKKHIQEATIDLEERIYQLIALYQPMAKDMREIACMLKIITSAERIGRYGKDIANMVKHLKGQPDFVQPLPIMHMAGLVIGMIDDVMHAFETESIETIKEMSRRDDTVDSLWHSMFRETLTFMMENPKTITRGTYYIMVARYLERSGDHACKMAENVHYMVTGKRIEVK